MIHVRAPCFETIKEIRSSKDAKQASVARCLASDDPPRHSRSKSRIAQVSQPFTWELGIDGGTGCPDLLQRGCRNTTNDAV